MIEKIKDWLVWVFQNPYNLSWPYGFCPVQCDGNLPGGEYYYFRARGSNWSFYIANEEFEVFDKDKRLFQYSEKYGETFEAGWMSKREAIKFATAALNKYYEN